MDWYLKVVRDNYKNFEGRARRKEYWMFILFHIIVVIVLSIIESTLGLTVGEDSGILSTIYLKKKENYKICSGEHLISTLLSVSHLASYLLQLCVRPFFITVT